MDLVSAATRPVDTRVTAHRVSALDGLRGAACVLVVLNHVWLIVPLDVLDNTGPAQGLFQSGSLGVTGFLVLGGFLVTSALAREQHASGTVDLRRFWSRRLARLVPQLYGLLLVVIVTSWVDRWDTWTPAETYRSVLRVATFTWNWYLIGNAEEARADLGHLWYLSVELQYYVVFVLVIAIAGRYRAALMALLAAAFIAVTVNRLGIDRHQGWYVATLKTTARIDGLLLGSLAALVYPYLRGRRREARAAGLGAAVLLVALLLLSGPLNATAYLRGQGVVFALAMAALVLAIAVAHPDGGKVERALSATPLVAVGRISFPLYLWHLPIFYAAGRWADDWPWAPRVVAALALTAGLSILSYTTIEQPVARRQRSRGQPARGA